MIRLIDILGVLKGYMMIEVSREHMKESEDGKIEKVEELIYKGRLRDWDIRLQDIDSEYVDFIYIGCGDCVDITLK